MMGSESLALSLLKAFGRISSSPMYRRAELRLDAYALSHACEACHADLGSHCSFQGIPSPDAHKIAAFLFKWICKFSPVFPRCAPSSIPAEALLNVNSMFALIAALGYLNVDPEKLYESGLMPYIAYSGTFRDIDPTEWAVIFFMMESRFRNTAD